MTLPGLIDKQDNVEVIKEKIGTLLLAEVAAQKALAPPQDPRLWDLRVFLDRTNPWTEFQQAPDQLDAIPIVNVTFETTSIDERASNVVESQTYNGTFSIDCYGYGVSSYAPGGHVAGDRKAQEESLRATRLTRNILMAGEYTYLDLPDVVNRRLVQGIEAFTPPQGEDSATQVRAHRISLGVRFRETAPQVTGEALEEVHVTVKRKETGEIYLTALYDTI